MQEGLCYFYSHALSPSVSRNQESLFFWALVPKTTREKVTNTIHRSRTDWFIEKETTGWSLCCQVIMVFLHEKLRVSLIKPTFLSYAVYLIYGWGLTLSSTFGDRSSIFDRPDNCRHKGTAVQMARRVSNCNLTHSIHIPFVMQRISNF